MSFPGAPSAPAAPEVVNFGLVQRVSPPMCSLGHRDTTMCRGENYLRMNPQPTTEMFYRYCLKPMAPWDIYYGGQPGSPCGAVKRGPAQFQVALPIETQVPNSRKVAMWGRTCAAGYPRAPSAT